MLKMLFKPQNPEDLGLVLAAYGYAKCWDEQGQKIVNTFQLLTEMQFKQRHITAIIVKGERSKAGKTGEHMKLSECYRIPENKLVHLSHELAHRLLGGNKVWTSDSSKRWRYDEHLRIYLFLYDTWSDLYGEDFAAAAVAYECQDSANYYKKAWNAALSMSREERHAMLHRLVLRSSYKDIVEVAKT